MATLEAQTTTSDKYTAVRKPKHVTGKLVLSAFSSVCGTAFIFGYTTGVINNPAGNIKDFFQEAKLERTGSKFSETSLKWFWASCVAVWALFAPLGCILAALLSKKYGRKRIMLGNNVLLLVGSLLQSLCYYANSYEMFFIGRAIMGVNNGIGTSVCPMYLAEISPKTIRGAIGTTFQFTIVIGILVAQILGFQSILGGPDLWPHLFTLALCFGLLQCIMLPFCPESPQYMLIEKNNPAEARKSLAKLRSQNETGEQVEMEMRDMLADDQKDKAEPPVSYRDFSRIKYLQRALALACMLAVTQQFSGINAIIYYSEPIFRAVIPDATLRDTPDLPKYLVAVVGLVQLLITIVSFYTIDRLGRRLSILIGLIGMAVCTLVEAILFSDMPVEEGMQCHGVAVSNAELYTAAVFVFIYVAFFAFGVGAVPWLVAPELFTSRSRPKALGIVTAVNWLCNFTIAIGFPPLIGELCGWVFMIFFALLIVFIIYLWIKLPEVKGKPFDEIVKMFTDDADAKSYLPSRRPSPSSDDSYSYVRSGDKSKSYVTTQNVDAPNSNYSK